MAFSPSLVRCIAIVFPLAAFAHDLYFMPERFRAQSGQPLAVAMHLGDSFPNSEVAPKIERVQSARLLGANGPIPLTGLRVAMKTVIGTVTPQGEGTRVLVVEASPTSITMKPAEFEKYLRHEGLTSIVAERARREETGSPGRERYRRCVKGIVSVGAEDSFAQRPIGCLIEFVPQAPISRAKTGDGFAVQLLFQGQPLAGAAVEVGWTNGKSHALTPGGRTDSQGNVVIPLKAPGIYRLHSVHMTRSDDPSAADWESYWTSLTFQIEKE